MNNETNRLPLVAGFLIGLMLHGAERDEVLADLADEFQVRGGGMRARRWLWRQVWSSVPGLMKRSWHRGWTGFESEANEMKRGGVGLESWIMDARFALRGLRSRPQYVLLAVLTLGLGIGGTAAISGIATKILVDPLPYHASDELEVFWSPSDWSEREMVTLRDSWPGFSTVAAYRADGIFLRREGAAPQLLSGIASSAELFDVLGVRPLLGTGFRVVDDAVGAEPVAVLSHSLWQDLGGRQDIVGTNIEMDGASRRVVGVMPKGFWFPDPSVQVWVSAPMRPDNGSGNYVLIGRRTVAREAMAEPLRQITGRLAEAFSYPADWDKTKNAALTPVRTYLLGPVRPALLATLAGMGVILLMACANVATLMLGQLRGRTSELAVRSALGAGRRRLTQQLVIESLVLAALAGVMGGALAAAGFQLLRTALPLGELAGAVQQDWGLFLSAMGIAFLAALVIALAPVLSLWRGDLRDALNAARSGGIGARGGRLEDGLVIGEVALAVLLAAAAAVLIRSVSNLHAVDTGMNPRNVAVVDVTASSNLDVEARRQNMAQMMELLRSVPGVESAAAVQRLPLRDRGDNWGIQILEKPEITGKTTAIRVVTRDYFDVMGIRVLSGRGFDASDVTGGELVMVIDQELADEIFPGEDPIGQQVASAVGQGWMRIIGVVETVRHNGLTEAAGPGRYVLYEQHNYQPESASLLLRVQQGTSPAAALQQAARTLRERMSTVAVQDVTTMANVMNLAMGATRRVMQLMALMGALALTLGAIGVYGVVSHFVNRRRRDWVIRMALGMRPVSALGSVLARGVLLVSVGCALGLVAAMLLTRTIGSLLFQVDAADPLALAGAALVLIATGCVAALVPGIRATRSNPAQVLRES